VATAQIDCHANPLQYGGENLRFILPETWRKWRYEQGLGPLPAQAVRDFIGRGIPHLVERCLQAAGQPLPCGLMDGRAPRFPACPMRSGGCAELEVAPTAAAVIGDSANDAEAARAAGCPLILVTYGYNHGEDIRAVPALRHVSRLDEISAGALS
jgi:hypothetical protein